MAAKMRVVDLNRFLTCPLCLGYFIDATTLVECMHTFCRGCILRYFENKTACPKCNFVYKKKIQSCLRSDVQLQTIVYKLVPGIYVREMQRREDFYRSTGDRANSSCSDDSVLERDMVQDNEEWGHVNLCGDQQQFLSPDDSISLSLEYYQSHLDRTSEKKAPGEENPAEGGEAGRNNGQRVGCDEKDSERVSSETNSQKSARVSDEKDPEPVDRRFLRCSAAVTVTHIQRFLLAKYTLSPEHKVDIIYKGEVMSPNLNLMDIVYIYKWKRVKPMRFFYRILMPAKVRPIKIINTSSSGEKQLQIVPIKPVQEKCPQSQLPNTPQPPLETDLPPKHQEEEDFTSKERLMAELQLQSTNRSDDKVQELDGAVAQQHNSRYGKTYEKSGGKEEKNLGVEGDGERKEEGNENGVTKEDIEFKEDAAASEGVCGGKSEKDVGKEEQERKKQAQDESCTYDYEEPDQEEMKRFAESRDREWRMQKQQEDEMKQRASLMVVDEYKSSKKRKKSKHSKGDFPHKRHKLHAEITSDLSSREESIKLKVKLTPHNGHKHKHHKNSSSAHLIEAIKPPLPPLEPSSKEKLTQMRQIRHKNIGQEGKGKSVSYEIQKKENNVDQGKCRDLTITLAKPNADSQRSNETQMKTCETQTKTSDTRMKTSETQTKSVDVQTSTGNRTSSVMLKPLSQPSTSTSREKLQEKVMTSGKTLRSDFSIKTSASKDFMVKRSTVKLERNEQAEKQAQKTFLGQFQPHPEQRAPRVVKVENNQKKHDEKKMSQSTKSLQQQISRLQQQCSVKAKESSSNNDGAKNEKIVAAVTTQAQIMSGHYHHPGVTVNKIETNGKRKAEPQENLQDKRPSLEIVLINPPSSSSGSVSGTNVMSSSFPKPATVTKRPPPSTIPLERIKKSMWSKSGISIIPKMAEKSENIPLDLSKPHKPPEVTARSPDVKTNGLNININGVNHLIAVPDKGALSNLQMLSKVASEHPNIKPPAGGPPAKPKPQMPNLQTIKATVSAALKTPPNLAKLPKLNEINKAQFRSAGAPRNMRPNQNQSIRNIPNPSLLVRQNQNRLNSLSSLNAGQSSNEVKAEKAPEKASNANSEKPSEDGKSTDAESRGGATTSTS